MKWRQGEWGRVLAIMALTLLVGGGGLFVLDRVLDNISANARRIDKNATAQTNRINDNEAAFCIRLQRERSERNRLGAIVFVVLTAVTSNTQGRSAARVKELARLGRLPHYQPPTNCKRALSHPESYKPPKSIPFSEVDGRTLRRLLMTPRARN